MNLVLLLSASTVLGIAAGHGPHAGNFMASSPCFSFQGQNILWPAGPQGFGGMCTPWSSFNNPFFSRGGGAGGFPGMPGCGNVLGAPIEASSPASHDAEPSPAASVPHPPAPVEEPAVVPPKVDVHTVTVVPEQKHEIPAPITVEAAPAPSVPVLEHPATSVPIVTAPETPIETPTVTPTEIPSVPLVVEPPATPIKITEAPTVSPVVTLPEAPVAPPTEAPAVTTVESPNTPLVVTTPSPQQPPVVETTPSTPEPTPIEPLPTDTKKPEEVKTGDKLPPPAEVIVTAPTEASPVVVDANAAKPEKPCAEIKKIDSSPCDISICGTTLCDALNLTNHNFSDIHHTECHNLWDSCGSPYLLPHYDRCPFNPYGITLGAPEYHDNSFIGHSCGVDGHEIHSYPNHGLHNYPVDYGYCGEPYYETKVLPPISSLNISDLNELNFTDIERYLPSDSKIIKDESELKCLKHEIVKDIKPVVDECITHIPIIRNKIKEKEETFVRHIPIVTDHVSTCEENHLCHIPIVNQRTHNVIDHQTDHLPITQSRLVPIVQSAMSQIPVTRPYIRPIMESSMGHVPIVETNVKPVIEQSVSTIPVTEKRITPVMHEEVVNVPAGRNMASYDDFEYGASHVQNYHATGSGSDIGSLPYYPHAENHHTTASGSDIGSLPYYAHPENHVAYNDHEHAVQTEPEYDQGFSDFRRDLYLSPQTFNRNIEGFAPQEEPSSGQEYPEESYGYGNKEINQDSSDNYQYAPESRVEEPVSSPLAHSIPFPQENADAGNDYSAYTDHPDYCD